MLGTVTAVGAGRAGTTGVAPVQVGDRVVPLSSMSCLPLRLDRGGVRRFEHEVAFVDGVAAVAGSVPLAVVPDDLSDALCLFSLDISSLVPQVERLMITPMDTTHAHGGRFPSMVYVQGCGKSGVAAMAAIRRLDVTFRAPRGLPPCIVVASDFDPAAVGAEAVRTYADASGVVDSADCLATLDFLASADKGCNKGLADVVLACTTAPG
jgi:threonine dehydrogenase-like Zn-dependent dehydrogenase